MAANSNDTSASKAAHREPYDADRSGLQTPTRKVAKVWDPVPRPWSTKRRHSDKTPRQMEANNNREYNPLSRWLSEPPIESPYHDMHSVARIVPGKTGKKRVAEKPVVSHAGASIGSHTLAHDRI